MMDRRRFLLTSLAGALAAPLAAGAQHEGKMARMGWLAGARREMLPISVPTFVGQLREFGYIEGQNLVIEFRDADTQERFRELTRELAGVGVQVIYAANPYAVRGAREATMTLPIVGYDYESDPVAAGYAASLARPAGNVTGVFLDQAGVSAKQLQLLTELLPGLSRVAVLWDALLATPQHEAVKDAARRLGVAISSIVWSGPNELPSALRVANRDGAQALIVLSTPRIHDRYRVFVAAAALKSRLPSIVLTSNFAQDGALIAYGPTQRDMHRIAATLVAKILRGAKPGDLPIERPTKFELIINLKTAKALGLTIPPSLLARADQVIE
jgi:putative ABC transport system substrate-binding protein